jgi:hypothetical protein
VDTREGNSEVDYEPLPLVPPVKALAVTNTGALVGSPTVKSITSGASTLEICDLTKPLVLGWLLSFEGYESTFGATADTFADTLSATNYDIIVPGGQAPKLFAIPEGAVSYAYDNIGQAGTPIIIER